jgi:hypothetical protein
MSVMSWRGFSQYVVWYPSHAFSRPVRAFLTVEYDTSPQTLYKPLERKEGANALHALLAITCTLQAF